MKKLILFFILAIFAIASGYSQSTTIKDPAAKRYMKVNADGSVNVIPYKVATVTWDTIVRPANTASYVANDVVGAWKLDTLLRFTNCVASGGGSGIITKVKLIASNATLINHQYRIHIYNTKPTSIADTAQFKLLYANKTYRVGMWDVVTSTEGTGSDCVYGVNATQPMEFTCATASTTLWAVIETKTAFTGISKVEYFVELTIQRY
jgi:hypothetical protein